MTADPENMEEKIINAAIESLEKHGVQGTTNRKIAEIAGINSAAINYYFRSKEVLIHRTMEKTLENAFDWKDMEKLPGVTPQERCEAIFENLIEGGMDYPGITRAHFYDLFTSGDTNSMVVTRLNEFVAALCNDLQAHGFTGKRADLELACMQITSSVFMMIIAPQLFQQGFELDIRQQSDRIKFVHQLVNKLL